MGVFATTTIPRRHLVGAYTGRRYHVGESMPDLDAGVTYLFALSDGETIDGAEGGNATRFINHSCRPNCVAVEAYDEADQLMIEICTRRRVMSGEELTLDYALVIDDALIADYACRCGERDCRGSMAAPSAARR